MARLGLLLALPLLPAVATADPLPACPQLGLQLKASSKRVAPGGSTTATLSIKNKGWETTSGLIVGITLAAEYDTPYYYAMRPNPKPRVNATVSRPSTAWPGVTIHPRKARRFVLKARLPKCQPNATSLAINAFAYKMDGTNIACLSTVPPVALTVTTPQNAKRAPPACPAPLPPEPIPVPVPIPGATVTVVAVNQAFSAAEPAIENRRLSAQGRALQALTLQECFLACTGKIGLPAFAIYNKDSGACGCCATRDSCGVLVPSPGSDIFEILPPPP